MWFETDTYDASLRLQFASHVLSSLSYSTLNNFILSNGQKHHLTYAVAGLSYSNLGCILSFC